MDRLTEFDKTRGVYVIKPDATGNHIQRLGMYEDRDTPKVEIRRDHYSEGDAELECGNCEAPVGASYIFCPWCGQRVKKEV